MRHDLSLSKDEYLKQAGLTPLETDIWNKVHAYLPTDDIWEKDRVMKEAVKTLTSDELKIYQSAERKVDLFKQDNEGELFRS